MNVTREEEQKTEYTNKNRKKSTRELNTEAAIRSTILVLSKWNGVKLTELNYSELKWSDLNWNLIDYSEMKWMELHWIKVNWNTLNWTELNWRELKYSERKRTNFSDLK